MLRILRHYFPIRNIVFYFIEGMVIFGSILLSSVVVTFSKSYLFDILLVLRMGFVTLIIQMCLYYNDLYDFEITSTLPEMIIRLLQALGISSIFLAFVYWLFPLVIIDQKVFILSILILIVFIIGWRIFYLSILNKGWFNESIIILGSSSLAIDILEKIQKTIDCGYQVTMVIPDNKSDELDETISEDIVKRHSMQDLCKIAKKNEINKIVVALKDRRGTFPIKELIKCRTSGIEVIEDSTFYEMLTGKVLVTKINPSWLIFSEGFQKSKIRTVLKRLEDIVLSSLMLFLLSPVLMITAVLIKMDSKGPVLFSQDRVGLNEKEYMMHKFRSMVVDAEKDTGPVWAQANDDRITRVGKFIRKVRIDELPQLWDVLVGRMSLVGPRPERKHFTDELAKEIPYYSQRFNVKPGVTGWAQVSYDYGATVEDAIEKLNYDLFYIKNMSISMDMIILLRTVKTVLFGKGAR